MSKIGHKPHNCFVVLLSRACISASRSACINIVLFSVYHKMAKIEGEILRRTTNPLAKLREIQQKSNLMEFEAASFKFFKTHDMMLVGHNFKMDWDQHVDKLFKTLDCIDTEIMDEDIVDILLTKSQALWEPDGTCMANNALLLSCSANRSNYASLDKPCYGHVISATVVWVVMDQAGLSMPDTISTLLDMAKTGQDGVALCYIPISKPFFPYPENDPHMLIIPSDNNIPASLGFGMPVDYTAYEMTSYTTDASVAVGLTARLQFGPD